MNYISDVVIEMGKRIQDKTMSRYTVNSVVLYVDFEHTGRLVLSPKGLNKTFDYCNEDWMTEKEKKYLCDIVFARYLADQEQELSLRNTEGKTLWEQRLGVKH